MALKVAARKAQRRFEEDKRSEQMFSNERLELGHSRSFATISSEFWGNDVYDLCTKGPAGGRMDIHVDRNDGELEYNRLTPDGHGPHASKATFINVKSMNELMGLDKEKELIHAGRNMLDDIICGAAIDSPALLTRGLLLSYADVKSFQYAFWSACVRLAIPLGVAREIGPVQLLSQDRDLMLAIYKGVARMVLTSVRELHQTAAATLLPPVVGVLRDEEGAYRVVSLREVWAARYDHGSYIVNLTGGNATRERGEEEEEEEDDHPPASVGNLLTLLWHHKDDYTYPPHHYREGMEREPALVKLVHLHITGLLSGLLDSRSQVQQHSAQLFLNNEDMQFAVDNDVSKIYAIRLGDSCATRDLYEQSMEQIRALSSARPRPASPGGGGYGHHNTAALALNSIFTNPIQQIYDARQALYRACEQRNSLYDRDTKCSSRRVSESVLKAAWTKVQQAEE